MLIRTPLFVFLALFALTSSVRLAAQLIAYEGFEYPVMKQSPALWPVTNKAPDGAPLKYLAEFDTHASRSPYAYNIQIVKGSIPSQGSAFPFKTKGNALSWAREWLDAYGTIETNFQFDTANDRPPIYVSFLVRANKSKTPVRQLSFAFSNGSSHRLQFGVDDTSSSGKPRFFACAASPQPTREYSSKEFNEDTTYFVVGKITTNTNRPDRVQVEVFAPGDSVPDSDRSISWDVDVSEWTDFLVTDCAFSLYGGDTGNVLFDELRIGSSWEAVAVAPVTEAPATADADQGGASGVDVAAGDAEASADEKAESSPIVLVMIGLGIVAFFIGGIGFYLFVLKPSKEKGPAKPKSAPKPVAKPSSANADEAKPAAEKPAEAGGKRTKPRHPKKPPPPPK
ncbi:hypothetical protein [Cerasicoccus frondis]|uniref:hypothetical protein n=1 Tax=Cerasicoccus frondis TaxID=490090 RepID=UPI002852C536|nr:hypothetical protein [Cerasicoccus frondis]